MALTYVKTISKCEDGLWSTQQVRQEVTAFDEWGMYTRAGNKSLQRKAQRLIDRVEKLVEQRKATRKAVRAACVTFVAGWERMSYSKTMSEAGDSAVREPVGDTVEMVWDAVFGDHSFDLWDEVRDEAYMRVRDERERRAS